MSDVRDNPEEQRFELMLDGYLAIVAYSRKSDTLVFEHTSVPEELEGKGVGTRLVEGALAEVRTQGLKVVPACSFVATYFERHPDMRDLLAR